MMEPFKSLLQRFFSKEPILELSYSKISAYLFCPWKYKLLYVDGFKVPPNPFISLGLTIHRTLENYHKGAANSLDGLMEIYDRVWVNEGFQTPQQTVQFYEKGKKMLEQYFEFSKNRKSQVIAVEKEFRFLAGTRFLRGIIDRMDRLPDGSCEIIDYKTHAEMWNQARIDTDLQLTLYAMGAKRALNITPSHLSYFFLAHNKVAATHRTEEQEKEALHQFEQVAQKIEARQWNPDPRQCLRCDFKNSCRYSTVKGAVHGAKKNEGS